MIKKLFTVFVILGIFFVSTQHVSAAATIPPLEGNYYLFGGKIKVDLKSGIMADLKTQQLKYTPLLDVSATIYDATLFLAGFLLQGSMNFGPGAVDGTGKYLMGPMAMGIGSTPFISGTYKQEVDSKGNPKNNKFTVDVDMETIIAQLKQMLVAQLGDFFEVEVVQTKGVMSGTYLKKKIYYKGIYDPAQDKKVGTASFSAAFNVYWPSKDSPLLQASLTLASQPTTIAIEPPDETAAAIAAADGQAPAGPDTMKELLQTFANHIASVVSAYQAQ
jgi:hypothetical protein